MNLFVYINSNLNVYRLQLSLIALGPYVVYHKLGDLCVISY